MAGPWSVMDPLAASSSDSSEASSDSDSPKNESHASQNREESNKKCALDFEAISKHGYSGGPSVLHVPPPKPDASQEAQDWAWSCGKRKGDVDEEEGIVERDATRRNANDAAVQSAAQAIAEYNYAKKQRREAAAEAKTLSFSQKEKRKRDFGQASRGKNYVEEEKRILRDQGVYSGFDV